MIQKINNWRQLQIHRLREQGVRIRLKLLIKKVIRHGVKSMNDYLFRHPRMRVRALSFVDAVGLKKFLKSIIQTQPKPEITPLSSRANQVLSDLQKAIDMRKGA